MQGVEFRPGQILEQGIEGKHHDAMVRITKKAVASLGLIPGKRHAECTGIAALAQEVIENAEDLATAAVDGLMKKTQAAATAACTAFRPLFQGTL